MAKKKRKRPSMAVVNKRIDKLLKGKKITPVTETEFDTVLKNTLPKPKKAKR
jgi:hypothetical protein